MGGSDKNINVSEGCCFPFSVEQVKSNRIGCFQENERVPKYFQSLWENGVTVAPQATSGLLSLEDGRSHQEEISISGRYEEDTVQIRIGTNAYMYRYNNIICQQVNPQVPLEQREITEVFQIQHRTAHFLKLIPHSQPKPPCQKK